MVSAKSNCKTEKRSRPVVAITRPFREAKVFAKQLERVGIEAFVAPTIRVERIASRSIGVAVVELRDGSFDYAIFTSKNGVEVFVNETSSLSSLRRIINALNATKIYAIGVVTAKHLRKLGVKAVIVPKEYSTRGLIKSLSKEDLSGKRVLVPRSRSGSSLLTNFLKSRGAHLTELRLYTPGLPKDDKRLKELVKQIIDGSLAGITFTSPSTFHNLIEYARRIGAEGKVIQGLRKTKVASIGPVTKAAVERSGIPVTILPTTSTSGSLLKALLTSLVAHNK